MRIIDKSAFLRCLSVMNDGEVDFFLGSGASAQAGIPTGGSMIWEFKRQLYCSENAVSTEMFKDLCAGTTQCALQAYFDSQNTHPALYSADEYAHYFETCYPTTTARERYIQSKVTNIQPSLGHLCLGDLFINGKVRNVWTTNFDELVEAGIKTLAPHYSFNVYSSANRSLTLTNDLPCIAKLHGDYRYDHIKNTPDELQSLESSMQSYFTSSLSGKMLVVIGYSGSDESIMSVLEKNIESQQFLISGLIWALPSGVTPNPRLSNFIEKACQVNQNSGIVYIDGFDEFLHDIYISHNGSNAVIDNGWKDYPHRKLAIQFNGQPVSNFMKLNAFECVAYPDCAIFDTDISSWKELRTIIGETGIIAALYSRHIYCFEDDTTINNIFGSHVKSSISKEQIDMRILYKNDSIYIGLLYELIKKALTGSFNLVEFRRNKYYDPTQSKRENYPACNVYNAIEVSLSVHKGKIYLNIIPTVYLTDARGKQFERFQNQKNVNALMSKIYNSAYNDLLKKWCQKLINNHLFNFQYQGFALSFNPIILSCGGNNRNPQWIEKQCFQFTEPEMLFSVLNSENKSVNQLKGIVRYAPLDYSYASNGAIQRQTINLAVISPRENLNAILTHLGKLTLNFSPQSQYEGFLVSYNGFDSVYKRTVNIPQATDITRVFCYDSDSVQRMSQDDFLAMLKRYINTLSGQNNFDIAVIYIPTSFSRFREDTASDFNLHDAIKLYATDKSVKVQIIEERSTTYSDQCKVMWGLSTSLYAKASGVLWQPAIFADDTAFVGISYALSKIKGTCIGCSQLFDSTGTGIRLLLRKIDDPGFRGRNPYMKSDEARTVMSALRDQYYKCDPTNKLKRIVVHKTTPFTLDEIKGFTQALEGIDDVELLQIQEYSSWRAIRYDSSDYRSNAAGFSIQRGSVVPLDSDSFLLWTHGCVQHNELLGQNRNYYKGGRGIPTPLLVKRFYGKASGDVIAKEILMLTKMNWNSGDTLYKQLPVTLDFAKVLSRMSKQNEAIYNKPYDFRYFM